MNISERLDELMLSYRREARRCLRAKAYLAATVMQVAAFEAGLQAMCFLYPEEVKRTSAYAKKHFRGKRRRALEFSLHQLINVADELGWFPPKRIRWAGKRTTLAGYSHEIAKYVTIYIPECGRATGQTRSCSRKASMASRTK